MPVLIGTSGYQYRHWLGRFYPRRPRLADDLAYYAARYQTVELNGTFYRLPEAETFANWAERVPDDFIFAVKASRYLTHIKRLADPKEPVERLVTRARRLGTKLGPVLLQLPPTMKLNLDRLQGTLAVFPPDVRIAVEFRHESWYTEPVRDLLVQYGAALCLADRGSRLITPEWRTADWGYVRFHGGLAQPVSCYEPEVLADRLALVARLWSDADDIFVYFNNDWYACALRDAHTFAEAVAREGRRATRVAPPPRSPSVKTVL